MVSFRELYHFGPLLLFARVFYTCKWSYKWVNGVLSPYLIGVITPLLTGMFKDSNAHKSQPIKCIGRYIPYIDPMGWCVQDKIGELPLMAEILHHLGCKTPCK